MTATKSGIKCSTEDNALKLFVVGEYSGIPEEWHSEERAFVIARSSEEAKGMISVFETAFEVNVSKPMVLCREIEHWLHE